MRKTVFFESYGTLVVGIMFEQKSDKVLRFHIVEAIDYPEIDHDAEGEEVAVVNYFNLIGRDGEVVEEFEHANLIASGSIVLQYPEEKVNPIAYTIELQSGVIFSGFEFNDLVHIINNHILAKAFLFLSGQDLVSAEFVPHNFATT